MNVSTKTTAASWRSVATGSVLVAAISVISPWAILVVKGSQLTSNAIPIITVVMFFALVAVGVPLLKVLGSRFAYSRGELITVYVMMLVGSVVVTTGFTGSFLSVITGATYYATAENNWGALFVPNIHPWLAPVDSEAVRLFYEGLPAGMEIPWAAWIKPLASWTVFMLVFYWVIFCIGALLRGQWVDNERLVYPLTRLPLAMIEDADDDNTLLSGVFKSKLMWMGFAIPLLLHTWNSMNDFHDAFQKIAVVGSVDLLQGLVSLPVRLNLPVMGLAYLMPLNVSFSVWFFFIIGMIQRLIFTRIGIQIGTSDIWDSGGVAPALLHQQAGGIIVLAIFVVWTARGHLRRLWRHATRGEGGDLEGEVIAPAVAIFGLAGGILLLLAWLVATGLSFYVAVLLLLGALIVFISLSRIVCEAGLPGCQTPKVPQAFISRGFGPEVLGLKNLTGLGLSTVWIGETAANMMNAVVHALKLTSTEERADRRLPWAMLLAVVIGLTGSIWFTMTLAHKYGGINLHNWYFSGAPRWPFRYLASVYNAPEPFGPRLMFTGIGASVMSALLYLRHRLLWWPLHPIGFPIAQTYTVVSYGWFAIFTAWLCKAIILRYGGVQAYRTMLPFFLGLILGEFTTAGLWVFIDGAYGVEGNMIFNF